MAKCEFSFEFSESADSLVNKATEVMAKAGGVFKGDTSSGQFDLPTPLGAVKGSYAITGSTIRMSIDQKPMLISCSRIENELRNYFAR